MPSVQIDGKSYDLKFGYKQLRRLEDFYPGRSFQQILNVVLSDPSFSDIEKLIFASVVDRDFSFEEIVDKFDRTFDSGEETLETYIDAVMTAVDESLFLKNLSKEAEATAKKANLKKQKAI